MSDEDDHRSAPTKRSTQVSFEAPASLVERVETIARIREEDIESVLVEAVRTHLYDAATSEDIRRRVAEQYYDEELALEQVQQVVGTVEAQRLRLLIDDLRNDPLDL